MSDNQSGPLIQDLSADNDATGVTELESLCMQCHEQVNKIT